ncbi:pyridoxal 5'-phosphate synthase glutaminase subunit PdxT [Iamia sp. SCSIO 61187]|uniref:pyridoxal 5'-phosphate synthase glutaminase subunit PdxT n=1 Tax=Iamia sp. SCSIO 61187 TaxID=2722752 RepID=UPI001C62C772|nr:pyridoxal 5'-phosphate synthase glutaminase subunit PdxT [Iamia sp. SCSIO 61187]
MSGGRKVGVLALQGAVRPHLDALVALGATPLEVRTPDDLAGVDGLVLPGGESTTMSRLLDTSGLRGPLGERLAGGMPALGTCAGMILLATEVLDGRPDQRSLGAVDIRVRRNAFGRQVDSFEADLEVAGDDVPLHAVFIRAPVIEEAGPEVEVLAAVADRPVLARQGPVIVASFHPELTDDLRLHQLFLSTFEE